MKSLRRLLLVWLLGLLTAAGVLAASFAYVLDRNEINDSLDGQLRQLAMNVGETDVPASVSETSGVMQDPEDEFVLTIWDQSGQPHSSDPSFHVDRPAAAGYANFVNAGEVWRAYTRVAQHRTIEVAQRMVVRDEFAANAALRSILPILLLIPMLWLLVGWVVGRVLRPLEAVATELRQWGAAGTKPLTLDRVPSEIMPLALATNDLVMRLQAQLDFREQFVSDAAHELRTPLTALLLQAKNLSKGVTSPEQASLVADMAAGIRRMSDMVGKLLQLARADTSAPARTPAPVDLRDAIAASVQEVVPVAAEKEIDIGVIASTSERVVADPNELRTLIANLVENAVRYTPHGGVVDLSVERVLSEIVLEVRDTGPGIPEELLDKVFGRFVRVRGSDVEGSGLGLPIVKAIADRCGARVSLVNRRDRAGLIARVSFASVG